jgi:hypothetical protein
MNRKDVLIAKLKAKQRVRQAVMSHKTKFAPPAPPQQQQEVQNVPNSLPAAQPVPAEIPPDQPV